ncbi:MAG: restriction endonuclease [Candidatus Altiarchaeota archaeon]
MVEIEGNYDFKRVIAKFVEKMGFEVDSVTMRDDGSVDFKAKTKNPMGGRVFSLIRASTFTRLVNGNDVKDLVDTMGGMEAVRAAYITLSGFSEDAIEAAKDKPVSLINKYQLMDSIEKRGLMSDKELMDALDRFGMGEQHFQGYEQSFQVGKSEADIKSFFQAKCKKDEKVARIVLRYSPLSVFKVLTRKDVWTGDQVLRRVERKDYLFVSLNSLDLYYITQRRKKNKTEYIFMRSDIIRRITNLPDKTRENLIQLLEHGDLPAENIDGKDLSILKNTKVIEVYEGKRNKGDGLIYYAEMFLAGTLETVNILVNELTSGLTSMGEGGGVEKVEQPPKKNVTAEVSMPHIHGGIYDIWKYLYVEKGVKYGAEIDPLAYTSSEIAKLLKSIFNGKAESEGIIFMPYHRAKFIDLKGTVTRYEILAAPKFKEPEEPKKTDVKGVPKIHARGKIPTGKFKIIR